MVDFLVVTFIDKKGQNFFSFNFLTCLLHQFLFLYFFDGLCIDDLEDSKLHKGEFFRINNLFQDLLATILISDIIGKHDERLRGIHHTSLELNSLRIKTQPKVIDKKTMSYKYIEEVEKDDINYLDKYAWLKRQI